MQLRPYQIQGIQAVKDEFASGVMATLLVAATGTGKTVLLSEIAKYYRKELNKPILFLAHRQELLDQAADTFRKVGLVARIEKAEERAAGRYADVVVASVQSLTQQKRLESYAPDHFGLIETDECFPAGTLVDGRPIETIQEGDFVRSFNHATGVVEPRRVVNLFKNPVKDLVRVTLADGRQIVCTPGHPFFTESGYVEALGLSNSSSYVFISDQDVCDLRHAVPSEILESDDDPVLQAGMYIDRDRETTQASDAAVRTVRQGCRMCRDKRTGPGSQKASVLLGSVPQASSQDSLARYDGSNESQVRIGAHDSKQSHESARMRGEDDSFDEGAHIFRSRREWSGHATADSPRHRTQSSNGGGNSDFAGQALIRKSSDLLQGRYRGRGEQNCDRGRWEDASAQEVEVSRRPQDGGLRGVRVVRVEIYERGGGLRREGLCGDGFVYNIEVEGNHNYFVDDVLVHNCHHSVSPSYIRVYEYFKSALHLGVTATAGRLDKIGLKNVYETVAFQYPIQQGIQDGFLCPIRGVQVEVGGIQLEKVKVVAGEFSQPEMDAMLRDEETLQSMVLPTVDLAGDRPTIVFTPGVEHAHEIAACFNRVKPGSATAVDGGMDPMTRKERLDMFKTGRVQFLSNVNIATEGFDHPPTACIAFFRPTKSLGLFSQCVGRATRIHPSKSDALILDFVGVNNSVRTVTVMDVLDGTILSDAEHKKAQELQKQGYNATESLEKAKNFVANLDSVRAKMRAFTTSSVFDVMGLFAIPSAKGMYGADRATVKQIAYLEKCGIKCGPELEKGEASKLIDTLVKRIDTGKATFKQMKYLRALGYKDNEIENVTFQQASDLIGQLKNKGRGAARAA